MQRTGGDRAFDQAYAAADLIPGWLTRGQARELFTAAATVPAGGTIVEIGSHQGRSTVMLARGAADGVEVVAIDPFGAAWKYGGPDTRELFEQHLREAGVRDRVRVEQATSREVRRGWHTPVDLVFVDGKHDVVSTWADLRWAEHLPDGGTLLLHDAFSSLGVTLAVLGRALPARRLQMVGREGSLLVLRVAAPTWRDRARIVAALPWFVGNLAIKVLLRLRLHAVARRLGHHDTADPY